LFCGGSSGVSHICGKESLAAPGGGEERSLVSEKENGKG